MCDFTTKTLPISYLHTITIPYNSFLPIQIIRIHTIPSYPYNSFLLGRVVSTLRGDVQGSSRFLMVLKKKESATYFKWDDLQSQQQQLFNYGTQVTNNKNSNSNNNNNSDDDI